MKRLINGMDATAMKLSWAVWRGGLDTWFDEMCKPIPEWYDNLKPKDQKTWILCFVSNFDSGDQDEILWICDMDTNGYYRVAKDQPSGYQYRRFATPVDTNIRYKEKG